MAWGKISRLFDGREQWKFGEERVPLKKGFLPCKNGNNCMDVGEHQYKKNQYSYRTNFCPYHFYQSKIWKNGFYRMYYYEDSDGMSYLYNFSTLCEYKEGEYNFTPTPPKIGEYNAPIFSKTISGRYSDYTEEHLYLNGFNGDFSNAPTYPQALIDFFVKAQNLKRSIALLKKLSNNTSSIADLINKLWSRAIDIGWLEGESMIHGVYDEVDQGRFLNIFASYNLTPQEALRKNIDMLKNIKRELIFAYNQDKPFAKKDDGKMAGEEHYHPLNAFWENGDKKGIYRSFEFERERFYQRQAGESKYSPFNSYEISNGLK